MRRRKVVLREEAIKSLDDIYRYIAEVGGSPLTAIRFIRRIKRRCGRIGEAPFAGRARDDLEPGLRTVPFERRLVIAYKVEADRVLIVDVFYGGRDYEALFRDQNPAENPPET